MFRAPSAIVLVPQAFPGTPAPSGTPPAIVLPTRYPACILSAPPAFVPPRAPSAFPIPSGTPPPAFVLLPRSAPSPPPLHSTPTPPPTPPPPSLPPPPPPPPPVSPLPSFHPHTPSAFPTLSGTPSCLRSTVPPRSTASPSYFRSTPALPLSP